MVATTSDSIEREADASEPPGGSIKIKEEIVDDYEDQPEGRRNGDECHIVHVFNPVSRAENRKQRLKPMATNIEFLEVDPEDAKKCTIELEDENGVGDILTREEIKLEPNNEADINAIITVKEEKMDVDEDTPPPVNAEIEEVPIEIREKIPAPSPTKEDWFCHIEHQMKYEKMRAFCSDCDRRVCAECACEISVSMRVHFSKGNRKLPCSYCGLILSTTCAHRAHERLHRKDGPYVCPDCGKVYNTLHGCFNLVRHFKSKCFHLNRANNFECSICPHVRIPSRKAFLAHAKRHVTVLYRCRRCPFTVWDDKRKALLHVRAMHQASFLSEGFSLLGNCKCKFCGGSVGPNSGVHMSMHNPRTSMSVLLCPCGQCFNTHLAFRHHNETCPEMNLVPPPWDDLFIPKQKDGLFIPKYKKFVIPEGRDDRHLFNVGHGLGLHLLVALGEEVEVGAEDEDEDLETCELSHPYVTTDHDYCKLQEGPAAVKEELQSQKSRFDSPFIQITRGSHLTEKVVEKEVRPVLTEIVANKKESDENVLRKFGLKKLDRVTLLQKPEGVTKCPLCPVRFYKSAFNDFCKHMKVKHTNAVIQLQSPSVNGRREIVKNVGQCQAQDGDEDDVDLVTRLKNIKSSRSVLISRQHISIPNKSDTAGGQNTGFVNILSADLVEKPSQKETNKGNVVNLPPSPERPERPEQPKPKRMRLYIPKKIVKPVKLVPKPIPKPSKSPGFALEKEQGEVEPEAAVPAEPERKEHEVWDALYQNLNLVEKNKRTKYRAKKRGLGKVELTGKPLELLANSMSKRIVKKPKRLLEEAETIEGDAPLPVKTKPESDTPLKVKAKKKDVPEVSPVVKPSSPKKKVKQRENEEIQVIDAKTSPGKKSVKTVETPPVTETIVNDSEISFLEKNFGSEVAPNKRKRKLSSKIAYFKKLNDETLDFSSGQLVNGKQDRKTNNMFCAICNKQYSEMTQFKTHLISHRTDKSTFQCMECGECFVVRPSLVKHLHAFHKIKDTDKYIADNGCSQASEIDIEVEEQEKNDVTVEENQCKVCREKFVSHADLTKHFRIHGMAFLKEAKKAI